MSYKRTKLDQSSLCVERIDYDDIDHVIVVSLYDNEDNDEVDIDADTFLDCIQRYLMPSIPFDVDWLIEYQDIYLDIIRKAVIDCVSFESRNIDDAFWRHSYLISNN